ncbi:uncharacterized protein LOC62_05G007514 [Vanrija pseudolonga]|uniref:Uncharacterized protein n=1 Tax=Vanrija pseudolonga TaxID=143232 RepID=A0AAF1BSW2_9TREE|nr:hypothetical protein LOC62_05G007514 [Vanrija pseudolonga]
MLVSTVGGFSSLTASVSLAPPSPSPFGASELQLRPPQAPLLSRRPSARSVRSFRSWVQPPAPSITAMRFESSSSLAFPSKAIRTSKDAITTLQLYPGPVVSRYPVTVIRSYVEHKLLKGRTPAEISYKLEGLEGQLPQFATAFVLVRYFNNLGTGSAGGGAALESSPAWPPDLAHLDQDIVDAARVTMNLVAIRPPTRRSTVAAALFGALRPRTRSLSALKAAGAAGGTNRPAGFSSLHLPPRSSLSEYYPIVARAPSAPPAPLSPPPPTRPTVVTTRRRAPSSLASPDAVSPASSTPHTADMLFYPTPHSVDATPTTATTPTQEDTFGMSINIGMGTPSLRSLSLSFPGGTTATPVSTPVGGSYPPQLSVRLPDLSLDGLFDFPRSPTLEGERAYTTDDIVEREHPVSIGPRPATAFL